MTAATLFVVQDAFEMTSPASFNSSSLAPITMVFTSSLLDGADITTFLAPALMCALAASPVVNRPVVSLSDVTMLLRNSTSKEAINDVLTKASHEPYYQGIVAVSNEPLVSTDYVGNPHSGIVDLQLTNVVAGNLAKVVVWYDNEWGYSNRLVELVADTGRLLHGEGNEAHQD